MSGTMNFDNLPSTPEGSTTGLAAFNAEAIKASVSDKLYVELTGGDDNVTVRAIESGSIRAEGILSIVGKTLDLNIPVHREIVRLLTLYDLYIYVGDSKGGAEYQTAATDLVSARYGSGAKLDAVSQPAAAVAKPMRRRLP